MPRISELPNIQPIGIHGDELLPVVDSGTTSQARVIDLSTGKLSHGQSSLYHLFALSYEENGYTSIAGIKLYQDGVEIPSSAILGLTFIGSTPTILNGTLANLIDGDPETYIRFQFDINNFDTGIEIQLDNTTYRIDEVAILAPSVASGVAMAECPNSIIVKTAIGENNLGGNNNPLYEFADYADVNNNNWLAWNPGEEKVLKSPELLMPRRRLGFSLETINTSIFPPLYREVANLQDTQRIQIRYPFVHTAISSGLQNAIINNPDIRVPSEDVEMEFQKHRIRTQTITESTTLDGTYFSNAENYTVELFVCEPIAPITITILSSSDGTFSFNPERTPLFAKRTIVNASETDSVTLQLTGFLTVIESKPAVIPPGGSVTICEYQPDKIVIW